MRRNVTLDAVTGRFVATPRGQKTEKMRQEETRLGVRFEDDYLEKVVNGEWGQKRFSKRWHVQRSLIFRKQKGRRCWIEMLELPSLSNRVHAVEEELAKKGCPICGAANVALEKAHWIPRRAGGPASWWNLVALCPTCHTRLDNDDKQVVRDVQGVVLLKAVRRLLEQRKELVLREHLVGICTAIITRQVPDVWRPVSEEDNSADS